MQLVLPSKVYEQSYRELSMSLVMRRDTHCHKHNEPSARMIIANGGQLKSEIEVDGEVIQRYEVYAF